MSLLRATVCFVAIVHCFGQTAFAFDDVFRQPDHPIWILGQSGELGLSNEQVAECQELIDFQREEKSACWDEWQRVESYPKTEVRLTMEKWVEPSKKARRDLIKLVKERIPADCHQRYDELLLQFYIYTGEFYFAAELVGRPISREQANELRKRQRDLESARTKVVRYHQLIEAEILKAQGVGVDAGRTFRAVAELTRERTPIITFGVDQYWAKLQHPAVIAELGIDALQLAKLKAIGNKCQLLERGADDGKVDELRMSPPLDGLSQHDNIKRLQAAGVQAQNEFRAALSEPQRQRFKQIRYQVLMFEGNRSAALAMFGLNDPSPIKRSMATLPNGARFFKTLGNEIDNVKRAFDVDYLMIRNRGLLATVVPDSIMDQHMGKLSMTLLDYQVTGRISHGTRPLSGGFVVGRSPARKRQAVVRDSKAFDALLKRGGDWYAAGLATRR